MAKSIVSSRKLLCHLTEQQYNKVLEDLTLPNPQYEAALKFSGYSRVNLPKYLYFYEETSKGIYVPRGYDPGFKTISIDKKADHLVSFPRFLLRLRDTQQEAVDAFLASPEEDGFIVIPTGAGKSIVGLKIAAKLGQRALIIVQKDDLISGWRKDIMLCFGLKPCKIGLVKAKKFRIGEQFTLTTIQTLCKLPEDKVQELRECMGTIIQDEGHRAGAASYKVIDTFPARHRLGLTATYMRNDALFIVLKFYFGNVLYQAQEADGIIESKKVIIHNREIRNVHYSQPDIYVNSFNKPIKYFTDAEGKSHWIADLSFEELDYYVQQGLIRRKSLDYSKVKSFLRNSATYNAEIVADILKEAEKNKSCVVFCAEKEHLRTLKAMLEEAGIAAEKIQLYCGDATESKEAMKSDAESKRVLITLATLAIATEGTNVKAWESLFLAMSIGNEKDLIQVIGRGRRGKSGKTEVNVFDYRTPNVKGVRRHSFLRDSIYRKYGFTIANAFLKPMKNAHVGWI